MASVLVGVTDRDDKPDCRKYFGLCLEAAWLPETMAGETVRRSIVDENEVSEFELVRCLQPF